MKGTTLISMKWSELNDLIHKMKGHLELTHKIELTSQRLRHAILEELNEINKIIENQLEENENEG